MAKRRLILSAEEVGEYLQVVGSLSDTQIDAFESEEFKKGCRLLRDRAQIIFEGDYILTIVR